VAGGVTANWFVATTLEKYAMKKFTVKATVLAAGSVFGATAFAGAFDLPAAATRYAVEGVTASTAVTLPQLRYWVGVPRTSAQDFTVVLKPGAGATFNAASCAAAVPTVANMGTGLGAGTASLKRSSTSECAYEIDVTTNFAGDMNITNGVRLTFPNLQLASHGLATAGTSHSVSIDVWDLGETARIDNIGSVLASVATSANAIVLTPTADTDLTSTNVNDAAGALFGFIAQNGDTTRVADANFTLTVGNAATFRADGVTAFNFGQHATNLTLTMTGDFSGAIAGANAVQVALCGTTSNMTIAGGTATVIIPATQCNGVAVPGPATGQILWTSAGNQSLGTSRTFGLSGATATTGGTGTTLAGSASWWTWTANAITLQTPYFSTDPGTGIFSRFYFTNTGSAATYSATCFAAGDAGAITYGAARTGTLAVGQTMINARDICTFADRTRGAVTFTINAPVRAIKGVYNLVVNGTSNASLPLVRPYGVGTTE
jgi:hypothetical protein